MRKLQETGNNNSSSRWADYFFRTNFDMEWIQHMELCTVIIIVFHLNVNEIKVDVRDFELVLLR